MQKPKDPRGGPNRNQGRHKKFGNQETDVIHVRVPVAKKKEIKDKIEEILKPYESRSV
jgi:hypothetical protein